MHGVPAQHTSAPILKSLSGHSHCSTESLSGFPHTPPLKQLKVSHSHSWLAGRGLSLPHLGVDRIPLSFSPPRPALSWLSLATAAMGVLLALCVCVCVCSLDLPNFVYPSHSRPRSGGSLPWEGRELQSCNCDQGRSSPKHQAWGISLQPIKSTYHPFEPSSVLLGFQTSYQLGFY